MKYIKKHPSLSYNYKKEVNSLLSEDGLIGINFSVVNESTGTQSGTISTPPLNIEGLFNSIFVDKEERELWQLSDEDYKKMEYIGSQDVESWSYTPDDTDKDPIIKIVDLFQQAHELYFTPQIPTGRPLGKVSQQTFLEYTYVGHDQKTGGGQWSEEGPPKGPFISNFVFNKWRNGIEKIFQDKQLRKIFSNSKFKVKNTTIVEEPNKQTKLESIQFINEADELKPSKPVEAGNEKQGEIIFTFMRNMLDKNKLADFDSNKSKLMFDYFGIKGESVEKSTYDGSLITKSKRDIEPNTFIWEYNERPNYNGIDKRFFAVARSNELVFIGIILGHEIIKYRPNNANKDSQVKVTYFYYWKNNDKIVRDWVARVHKGFKLRDATYSTNNNTDEGIGMLNSLNDSGDAIRLDNCQFYLLNVKSSGQTSFKHVDVVKGGNNGYPSVDGDINTKLNFGQTTIKNYSYITEGTSGTKFNCDDLIYNKYNDLLIKEPEVKQKLKDALLTVINKP